ncbi:hypothetical protein PEPS_36530 (plasmid) [Persicobacter psychrovividus]|uniref:Uncharacterized protein n=2 Tax=Persicobacter psychrovividus TaxID=387638 RepID=A0ABN6LDV5_9BACT|nr:hypothetical protein PEPS_36530 [Persicobacter psychrovividus]
MDTMINNIRDVFSIFHDGGIVDCQGDLNKLILTIQCNYLAELINPDFENFYVDLICVNKLDFDPWMNPIDLKKIEFKSHEEYLKVDLEILSSEIEDDYVLITCNQHDTDLDYCGGNLIISANDFRLFDHNKNVMTIEELESICRLYWDKFSKRE